MISKFSINLGFLTFSLLVIFTIFLLLNRRKNTLHNYFLSAFLLTNALYMLGFLSGNFYTQFGIDISSFELYGFAFGFLFGPALYFYTKFISQSNNLLSWKLFPHFFPFLLQIINIAVGYAVPIQISFLLMHIQILIYVVLSVVVLKNFLTSAKKFFSSLERFKTNFLFAVFFGFISMWLIDFVTSLLLLTISIPEIIEQSLTFTSILINFLFAILLFYYGINFPQLMKGAIEGVNRVKYEYSNLSDVQKEEHLNKLLSVFKDKAPYLSPELSLEDLTKLTGIQARSISQVINEKLNKNFYDFVNEFRIEKSKEYLKETDKTVLEILYEVGFNSKSAFNKAFKKHTGLTPTEYRKRKAAA